MRGRCIPSAGFTLLEVMMAMALFAFSIGVLLNLEMDSLRSSIQAEEMTLVTVLARNRMIETECELEGRAFSEIQKESSGVFPAPYEKYTWKRTIQEVRLPSLMPVKSESEANSSIQETVFRQVQVFLSQSIREVTITVLWKKGFAEKNVSLSMYWVDFK